MPKILSFADGFTIERYPFGQSQVAANQSAVAIPILATKATNGSSLVTGITLPWAGSIIGISADISTAGAHGTLAVTPTLDGTAVSGGSLSLDTSAAASAKFDGQTVGRFAAGQVLGLKLTTNGSWDGTTSDLAVNVYVLFEGVQP